MKDRHAISPAAAAVAAIAATVFAALAAGCVAQFFTAGKDYVVSLESGWDASKRETFAFSKIDQYTLPECPADWAKPDSVFIGWFDKDTKDSVHPPGKVFWIMENKNFAAVWKDAASSVFSVTLESGWDESEQKTNVLDETYYTFPACPAGWEKAGFVFSGWKDTDTGTVYQPDEKVLVKQNMSFAAVWNDPAFSAFSVSLESGWDESKRETFTFDGVSKYTFPACPTNWEKAGSVFAGWKDTDTGSIYQPGDKAWVVRAMSFAAVWNDTAPTTFSVTLESGWNASKQKTDVFSETYYTFPECPTNWERTGFIFAGWKDTDTGVVYQPDEKVLVKQNMSFAAAWNDTAFHVSYDKGDAEAGEAPVDDTRYAEGTRVTVKGTGSLQKSGFYLHGWTGAPLASVSLPDAPNYDADYLLNAVYGEGEVFFIHASVALRPYWAAAADFYLSYDKNGGTGGNVPDREKYAGGDSAVVADPGDMTRDKHKFTGWNTKADGTGAAYAAGASIRINADTVLYAQWKLQYALSYDKNGGTGGNAPAGELYGSGDSAVVAGQGGMTWDKYKFTGWNTKADGTGAAYAAGASIRINADTVLYAQWKLKDYSLSYDTNGGIGENAPDGGLYDSGELAVVADPGDMTRYKYEFTSWNTKADGTGAAYAAGASIQIHADTVLYAQWKRVWYSVEYSNKADGGLYVDGMPVGIKLYHLGEVVTVPIFAHDNPYERKRFVGWNTELDGTGEMYQMGSTFIVKGDITLYAVWDRYPPPT